MTTYIYSIYNYFFPDPKTEQEKEQEKEQETQASITIPPVFDEKDTKQQMEDDLIDELLDEVTPLKLVNFYSHYDELMKEILKKPIINLKPLPQIEWKPIVEPHDPKFQGFYNVLDMVLDSSSDEELQETSTDESDWSEELNELNELNELVKYTDCMEL